MNYIVLDMEWNQPFNMKSMIKKPLMLHGEIVQIGAVPEGNGSFHNDFSGLPVLVAAEIADRQLIVIPRLKAVDYGHAVLYEGAVYGIQPGDGDIIAGVNWFTFRFKDVADIPVGSAAVRNDIAAGITADDRFSGIITKFPCIAPGFAAVMRNIDVFA